VLCVWFNQYLLIFAGNLEGMAKNPLAKIKKKDGSAALEKRSAAGGGSSVFRRLLGRFLRFFKKLVIFFFVSTFTVAVIYKYVPVFITPLMVINCVKQVIGDEEVRLSKDWVPIEEISPNMVRAAIASEDAKFLSHNGFDYAAIRDAAIHNMKGGRTLGASTISQQTAKNVFLWPSRSWVRKGLEVYFTFLIELVWGKERIMEVYLNVAETGHGIYGVEMASQIYFKKPAKKMSKWEAARLISIFPNPLKFSVVNPSKRTLRKQEIVMKRMNSVGQIPFLK